MNLSRNIAEAYKTLINEGCDVDVVANSVASFMKEFGLMSIRENILNHVSLIESEEEKYNTVVVHVADNNHKNKARKIADVLCGENYPLSTSTDSELIGGFKVRHRGKEWDASIGGVLERLRSKLKQ